MVRIMIKIILTLLIIACSNVWSTNYAAQQLITCNGKYVLGGIEQVKLLDNNLVLDAKLDTGATMSSLTATNIKIFKRHHKTWVQFVVYLPKTKRKISLIKPLKGFISIRKRNDEMHKDNSSSDQRRMIIPLKICMGNQKRIILVNLIDRSTFMYPMLIGRDTIKSFDSVIDVSQQYLSQADCR